MTIEELEAICRQLPGVTEDIKWEDHLCFNVGDKIFLITSPDQVPPTASFKVPDVVFEEVSVKPGFKPAAYLARYKWVVLDDISWLTAEEWEHYIQQSYKLVAVRLPAKVKKQIGL